MRRTSAPKVALLLATALVGRIGSAPTTLAAEQEGSASELVPLRLRCEYAENPLGVDVARPRLFWQLESPVRGERQTAYQILVASSRELLARDRADLWDSGRVASEETMHVSYRGRTLKSHQRAFWKVRAWGRDGRVSRWSEPATWTMGLLAPADWQAEWIRADPDRALDLPGGREGALPLFRREFQVSRPVRRALVSICGLGFYELFLNGAKVGDHVLDPGWTDYRKRCLYVTYDVTEQITRGANALGVMLGGGMYHVPGGRYVKFTGSFGPLRLILQLEIDFEDGTSTRVVSDATWRTAPGPIVFSCIFGGEDYDARGGRPGWNAVGYDDSRWPPVSVDGGPGGRLASQGAPPIKVARRLRPVKVEEPKAGVFVYDLGQNISGWPQLTVRGEAGRTVKMVPGELLAESGLVTQRSSGGPVSFSYTLKGEGTEVWHPRFSYYGFRYVQVEGATPRADGEAAGLPLLVDLEGHFVHSSARRVGEFSCSSALLGRIHDLIDRAIESNLQSVLTDCPHREKLGWLEVSHLLGPAIMFNYDVPALYRKICRDMSEAQLPNGLVPDIAPEYTVFRGGFRDSPEWGSASVINPWLLYQRYGDRQALEDGYAMMVGYVDYLTSTARNHIVAHGLGDWYDIGPGPPGESKLTTKGLTATAIYCHDLTILAQVAGILERPGDAAKYLALARDVRDAFNRRFFHSDSNEYDRGSQTANAMPLALGLVEPQRRAAVLANIVRDVRGRGDHLTAGDVGFRYLLVALAEGGRSDVVYDMTTRLDPPSYGSQLARGATTLTEAWDANPASSQNHCMLGHAEEWFYSSVAGIQPDPRAVGFRKIMIRPQVVGDLTWARARFGSIRGEIVSDWRREGGRFTLEVQIPVGAVATVFVPAKDSASISESGRPAAQAEGVAFLRREGDAAVCAVDSGRYRFVVEE